MQFSFAQEKTVTGTVTDGKLPLPAANVVIKGTKGGVSADMDGKFTIKAKQGDVLVVSYTGYETKTITVGAASSYKVALNEVAKTLDDVLVTGAMGIKRNKDAVVSSSQVVKAKEITQAANPNVIQSLVGKVSGLQINTVSNGVNAESTVVLRGARSITGNNQALVVIDNSISSLSVLATIPPDNIENVNVIKGQQGGALYGEQGSNGVIVVTTKKGTKGGKIEVTVNSSVDFQSLKFLPKRQDQYGQGWGYGYGTFNFPNASDPRNNNAQFEPFENGAWGPAFNDPAWANTTVPVGLPQANGQFLTTTWNSKGYDNIKAFYKTGAIYQNGVSVNMGSEDGYLLFSYNNNTSNFIVDGDQSKKNSFLLKAGKKIKKFSIDGSFTYINQNTSQTSSDLLFDLMQTPTNVDVSAFANSSHEHSWSVYYKNPFALAKQIRYDDKSDMVVANLGANYEFSKHLSLTYNGNLFNQFTSSTSHDDGYNIGSYTYNFAPYSDSAFDGGTYNDLSGNSGFNGGSYYATTSFLRKIYSDVLFNFNYDLTKDLGLKANYGFNVQDSHYEILQEGGTGLDAPGFYNITNILTPAAPSSLSNYILNSRRVATFANVDLDYKHYLFLNATSRYERASTVTNPFFYPSVGVSFIPTKAFEKIKGDVLDYMKLSASWVRTGNATPVNTYAVNNLAKVSSGFPFGDLASFQYNRTGTNPDIKPEFITTKELNANLGFFNDRITLDGSIYVTDTKDMITAATASRTTGNSTITDNTGSLQNKGFEIDLGLTPFRSKGDGFNWNMKGSFSKYKTVVTSLSEGVNSVNLQSYSGYGIGVFADVGEEFPLIKGTAFVRDPEGHIIVDANGTPQHTSTFQKLGKANPDFILGFSNNFSYKGISLTVVADYRTGGSVWSEAYNSLQFAGYTLESASQDRNVGYVMPNSVQQTSPGVYTTNTTPVGGGGLAATTNYFGQVSNIIGETSVIDASELKIRELALAYQLPSKFLKGTGIKSFKFGVNARNPFVFFFANGHGLKNEGYTDPEASNSTGNANGISNVGQYPTTKTYGFSLNLTF